jgi:hypothetical protein
LCDEVIVRLPDGQGVAVQHVPVVQQVADVQHVVVGQHVGLDTGQQTNVACAPAVDALVGIGQHGSICGHKIRDESWLALAVDASWRAPAGLATAAIKIAATASKSEDRTIVRRITKCRPLNSLARFHKCSAA